MAAHTCSSGLEGLSNKTRLSEIVGGWDQWVIKGLPPRWDWNKFKSRRGNNQPAVCSLTTTSCISSCFWIHPPIRPWHFHPPPTTGGIPSVCDWCRNNVALAPSARLPLQILYATHILPKNSSRRALISLAGGDAGQANKAEILLIVCIRFEDGGT